MTSTWLRFIIGMAFLSCWIGAAQASGVAIVMSERSAAYVEAADTVVGELVRLGEDRAEYLLLSVPELANLDIAGSSAPKVFVTLGTESLQRLLARDPRVPVVAALIPRSGFERVLKERDKKSSALVTALYLDQPFGRQLNLLRLALPEARKVGVLWGAESIVQQATLAVAINARGMEMQSGTVALTGSLFKALTAALDDADVLLGVADPQVFNSATVSNILLATYRARVPVLAFSPAYVKAGALLSLHTTPNQIGMQTAAMVRAIQQGGPMPSSQYPLDFFVTVNEHVARSMGLALDAASLAERLRRVEPKP